MRSLILQLKDQPHDHKTQLKEEQITSLLEISISASMERRQA